MVGFVHVRIPFGIYLWGGWVGAGGLDWEEVVWAFQLQHTTRERPGSWSKIKIIVEYKYILIYFTIYIMYNV